MAKKDKLYLKCFASAIVVIEFNKTISAYASNKSL